VGTVDAQRAQALELVRLGCRLVDLEERHVRLAEAEGAPVVSGTDDDDLAEPSSACVEKRVVEEGSPRSYVVDKPGELEWNWRPERLREAVITVGIATDNRWPIDAAANCCDVPCRERRSRLGWHADIISPWTSSLVRRSRPRQICRAAWRGGPILRRLGGTP
jgi:hypothetical protein